MGLALAEASERPSHGAPAFFVREKRCFLMFADDHHGDGRLAIWCAAPPGVQGMLVEANPAHYFVPPYVGTSGWIGARLDRDLGWDEIASLIEAAHATRKPRAKKSAPAAPNGRRPR